MKVMATATWCLRETRLHASGFGTQALAPVLVLATVSYGLVLGSRSLNPLQMLYSAAKMPALVTGGALVCMPSFWVLNTVLGLRDDFPVVLRAIARSQTTLALMLASLAPFTVIAYLSSNSYPVATTWNGGMFLLASLVGQWHLTRLYAPLVRANPRHQTCRRVWLLLHIFVTIQLAWMLRPFIGAPSLPTTLFRQGVWDNAYVVVTNTVMRALSSVNG